MKLKIFGAFLLTAFLSARGLASETPVHTEPAQAVVETLSSTATCYGIAVSSYTGTNMLFSTSAYNYRYVAIQNLDASYDLNCGDTVAVSSVTAPSVSNTLGMDVAKGSPGATITFSLVPGRSWYCKTQNTAATSPAAVCVGR